MRVRLSTIAVFVAAALSGAALIGMSQKVQVEEERLERLTASVAYEKETIRVLQAEWSYLNRPARIEDLAARYLHMQRPQARSLMAGAERLPDLYVPAVPARKPHVPAAFSKPSPSSQDSGAAPVVAVKQKSDAPVRHGRSFQVLLGDLSHARGGG